MDEQIRQLATQINIEIRKQNNAGKSVTLVITGNNSSGKTTITKELLKVIDVYQVINLGIVSKLIRYFRKDLAADALENFSDPAASKVFNQFIEFNLDHYWNTGVNIILEGVQVDTVYFTPNQKVTAGVILEVPEQLAVKRGQRPETHFKRRLASSELTNLTYPETLKFKSISNADDLNTTLLAILTFIHQRLLWLNATEN